MYLQRLLSAASWRGDPILPRAPFLISHRSLPCGPLLPSAAASRPCSYLAHGTATDYMHERLGVPLAMTWEVYGDSRAGARLRLPACLLAYALLSALRPPTKRVSPP